VLTPLRYNRLVGLLIACPVTKQAKGYPFESALPAGLPVQGVVEWLNAKGQRGKGEGPIQEVRSQRLAEYLSDSMFLP